jgi:hypothetical protein
VAAAGGIGPTSGTCQERRAGSGAELSPRIDVRLPTAPCPPPRPPPRPPPARPPDPNQKGFFGRSIKRLDALLDRSSADPLALTGGLGTRLSAGQRQALHLNRALLYLLRCGREGGEGPPCVLCMLCLLSRQLHIEQGN